MSIAHSKTEVDADQIIKRMRSVRRSGYDHAVELQGKVKRQFDCNSGNVDRIECRQDICRKYAAVWDRERRKQ